MTTKHHTREGYEQLLRNVCCSLCLFLNNEKYFTSAKRINKKRAMAYGSDW